MNRVEVDAMPTTDLVAAALATQEKIIERGLSSFLAVGDALMKIRTDRLYLLTHETFAEYCEARWGFSDSRARRLVIAAKAVNTVTAGGLEAPKSERVVRELAKVPEAHRERVWREVLERTGGKPTAAAVRDVVAPSPPDPTPTVPMGTVGDPDATAPPVRRTDTPKAQPTTRAQHDDPGPTVQRQPTNPTPAPPPTDRAGRILRAVNDLAEDAGFGALGEVVRVVPSDLRVAYVEQVEQAIGYLQRLLHVMESAGSG